MQKLVDSHYLFRFYSVNSQWIHHGTFEKIFSIPLFHFIITLHFLGLE